MDRCGLEALEDPMGIPRSSILQAWENPQWKAQIRQQSRLISLRGKPIAAWGVVRRWEGVFAAWAWLTPACAREAGSLVRMARRHLALAHERLEASRIQAEVAVGLPSGVRFVGLVGFEIEGKLRAYARGGREDCWMMASIR